VPWFTLQHHYPGAEGLASVTDVAMATLRRLRTAISAYDDWRVSEPLPLCLSRPLDHLQATHPELTAAVDASRRRGWLAALEGVDVGRWHRQHGDFCVNNLLIHQQAASIVDFEEFGQAGAPLHDAFSLAFSLQEFAERSGVKADLEDLLARCADDDPLSAGLSPDPRTALLVHHLCWRINQCATRPTRREIAARLAGYMRMVIDGSLAAR